MKIKEGLYLRKVGSQYMLVDNSQEEVDFTNVYTMNASAAYLWEKIGEQEFDDDLLVEWLCEKYEVEPEQAKADVVKLTTEWKKLALVTT